MNTRNKPHLKCFHHRIGDGHGHVDRDQFLNLDPFDRRLLPAAFKKRKKKLTEAKEKEGA